MIDLSPSEGRMAYDPDALDRRDPLLVARLLPLAERLANSYFRAEVQGLEHLPLGPALYVGNHNGGIVGPDLFCTFAALWRHLGPEFPLYALAHDFAMRQLPQLGRFIQRAGAVRASPTNGATILERGGQVLVYPGGDLEAYRPSRLRNRVMLAPRVGFVALARRLGVPIVPLVAAGAHRSAWILSDGQKLAEWMQLSRRTRVSRFPVALALPWGIAWGPWTPYLPLPWRVRLRFLPPIQLAPDETDIAASLRVQSSMQDVLDALTAPRRRARAQGMVA